MKKIIVSKKYNEKKLNTFLLDTFDGLSLNTIYKALRRKDIRINNVKVNENCTLHLNDEITLFISDELLYKKISLDIIYEDENILIIKKPSGIEVTDTSNSLTNLVCKAYNLSDFPKPCHRLDRNTTGLVLFAKNSEALNILLSKFKNYEIEKYYLCTVFGIPFKKSDTLISYLFKDAKRSLVYISDIPKKGYSKIVTSYSTLSSNQANNTSVLEVNLHTGKTHQIRAHLAHIGFPIIGDGKYGKNEINK